MEYDYANLLFTGQHCNSQCYDCIGNHSSLKGLPYNLQKFPIENIDSLIDKVNQFSIPDLAFTGTNVDPQLYKYERELISYIRGKINEKTKLSLHTNGLLALKKGTFNLYDKASVSFPSFNADTYRLVTKTEIPDIKNIIKKSEIPLKLSMLITPFNKDEIEDYVNRSADLGIRRIVVRKLKNREAEFPIESSPLFKDPKKFIFGWPVYNINGVEVTVCGFDKSTARGLFLFSDGRLEEKLENEA